MFSIQANSSIFLLPEFGWTVPAREVNTLAAAVQAGHTSHTQPWKHFHQQMSSLLLSTNNPEKYLFVELASKTPALWRRILW